MIVKDLSSQEVSKQGSFAS